MFDDCWDAVVLEQEVRRVGRARQRRPAASQSLAAKAAKRRWKIAARLAASVTAGEFYSPKPSTAVDPVPGAPSVGVVAGPRGGQIFSRYGNEAQRPCSPDGPSIR